MTTRGPYRVVDVVRTLFEDKYRNYTVGTTTTVKT